MLSATTARTSKTRENEKSIAFYNSLIDELLSHEIKPFITLYHWDLPFIIQKKGGWLNQETAKWFTDYAEAVRKIRALVQARD